MNISRRLLLSFFGLMVSFLAIAQTGTIRGFVKDQETQEPIIFTNVYLVGTTYGAATNVEGFFTIAKIPPGEYTLTVSALGYDSVAVPVKVVAGSIITEQ